MSPFSFNLQPLLEMRERTEDERKRDYAARIAEHNATIVALRRIYEQREEELRASRALAAARYDPRRNEDLRALVMFYTAKIAEAERRVDEALQARNAARTTLQLATREKKTLEALRERRRVAYLEARALREQEEIDEVNVVRRRPEATAE